MLHLLSDRSILEKKYQDNEKTVMDALVSEYYNQYIGLFPLINISVIECSISNEWVNVTIIFDNLLTLREILCIKPINNSIRKSRL